MRLIEERSPIIVVTYWILVEQRNQISIEYRLLFIPTYLYLTD
ncbi:hypothetical protein [Trichodesmium erythraeum]|nr:hypothetical protein [Trichodesmium sp. St11_bin5]MDT9338463.1 hypothetical protein [Trichodesmium erythraeum 21-75]